MDLVCFCFLSTVSQHFSNKGSLESVSGDGELFLAQKAATPKVATGNKTANKT